MLFFSFNAQIDIFDLHSDPEKLYPESAPIVCCSVIFLPIFFLVSIILAIFASS